MQQGAYPELLAEVAERVSSLLTAEGIKEKEAAEIGAKVAEFLREHWGGQIIYVPKGTHFDLSARDLKIWERWNGRNARELCREFDISIQRFRQIIAAVQRKEADKRQKKLF